MQSMHQLTPRRQTAVDPVSGLSLCGGIQRMSDFDPICTSPTTIERRKRRAIQQAKFESDAAAAAKIIGQRHQLSTNVFYTPSTIFPANVLNQLQVSAAAAAATNTADIIHTDIVPEQIQLLLGCMGSLCMQLTLEPALSMSALRDLYAAESRAESIAYAEAYPSTASTSNPDHVARHKFISRTRISLEAEIKRCQWSSGQKPTPHASIASDPDWRRQLILANILSADTLQRKFVSILALAAAVSADIQQFLASPTRGLDRLAVLRNNNSH